MSDLSEHPQEEADREGLDLVLPSPDELFIDIDDEASEVALRQGLKVLHSNGVGCIETKRTKSRSGNTHVYLRLIDTTWPGPLTDTMRVALQAVLGSDRKREALALLRISRSYDIPPCCFFEVPAESGGGR